MTAILTPSKKDHTTSPACVVYSSDQLGFPQPGVLLSAERSCLMVWDKTEATGPEHGKEVFVPLSDNPEHKPEDEGSWSKIRVRGEPYDMLAGYYRILSKSELH